MTEPYTMTRKRKARDLSLIDWQKRIKVLTLRQADLSFVEIGMQLGITRQRAHKIYTDMANMTIKEATKIAESLG